jgi:pseudouridine synthase
VRVDGRVATDPAMLVIPERVRVAIDEEPRQRLPWRTILLHKPRGTVTTRSDPQGRRTVFDVVGDEAEGLVAVGRLDLASSGALLLTTDTQLANWIADPINTVPRVYLVTVRGELSASQATSLPAHAVTVRKASRRETHVIVELRQGKNREIRRMFEAIGHPVTRLRRVSIGGLELGELEPGRWRSVSKEQIRAAFNRAPV